LIRSAAIGASPYSFAPVHSALSRSAYLEHRIAAGDVTSDIFVAV
jgi:hypothetical protein